MLIDSDKIVVWIGFGYAIGRARVVCFTLSNGYDLLSVNKRISVNRRAVISPGKGPSFFGS